MKKALVFLALILATSSTILPSCNKIKDEIVSNLDPFIYYSNVSFEIPTLLAPFEYTTPEQTEMININSIIRENAGINLNISNFNSIALKDITLHLNNGTPVTNWTNFEYIEVQANTDKGIDAARPWLHSNVAIANTEAERFTDKTLVFENENLKDYVDGEATIVHYRFKAKTRSAVITPMQIDAAIRYEFKP